MGRKSAKDKKLLLVPSNVVSGLMEIANRQGKPFQGFVAETLQSALEVYAQGYSLEEIANAFELLGVCKSLGSKIVSDDIFGYLIDKVYVTDGEILRKKMYEFGRLCGRNLVSKHENPLVELKRLLSILGWDLNEASATNKDEDVEIRCISPVLSVQDTELLMNLVKGLVDAFGYGIEKQDCIKGIISLRCSKKRRS
jgi:hypothetical protein